MIAGLEDIMGKNRNPLTVYVNGTPHSTHASCGMQVKSKRSADAFSKIICKTPYRVR